MFISAFPSWKRGTVLFLSIRWQSVNVQLKESFCFPSGDVISVAFCFSFYLKPLYRVHLSRVEVVWIFVLFSHCVDGCVELKTIFSFGFAWSPLSLKAVLGSVLVSADGCKSAAPHRLGGLLSPIERKYELQVAHADERQQKHPFLCKLQVRSNYVLLIMEPCSASSKKLGLFGLHKYVLRAVFCNCLEKLQ